MKSVNAVVLATHSPRKTPTHSVAKSGIESPVKNSSRLEDDKDETPRSGLNSGENSARGSVGDMLSKSRENSAKQSLVFSIDEENNGNEVEAGVVSIEDLENDGKQDDAENNVSTLKYCAVDQHLHCNLRSNFIFRRSHIFVTKCSKSVCDNLRK